MENVEVRISPDGESIAIRSENPADAWNAWGVIHRRHGGHWAKTEQVSDGWVRVVATEPVSPPEPEA